mgnify:CR=1 FL=1
MRRERQVCPCAGPSCCTPSQPTLSAFIIVLPYGVIKGIPPSKIRRLTDPYPFSYLPVSSPIRRLTVILARLPHPVTLTVLYPSSCFRLLGACFRRLTACFRLLGRGEAVRRERRGAAEVTDGGGRVVLLAVLLPAHELHDVTGKCLPHRLVGGGLLRLLGRGKAVRRESRQPAEVTDGTRSRLSQLGQSAQGAAFQTGEDRSPLLFLLLDRKSVV